MAAAAGLLLLVLLLLSFVLETRNPRTPAGSSTSGGRVAYFEFGPTADTLWLVSASDPSKREAIFTAPHAHEFGVVPSMAPTGRALVYAALPADTAAPGPDAPADLWYARLTSAAEPRLIASDVDLLVRPVWSPDATRVIFRRSDATSYSLVAASVEGAPERVLVMTSSDYALFPVGFSPDGATFYHVALSNQGSRLLALDTAAGSASTVAELSGGLTRDWTLSPDGQRLAYLALNYTAEAIDSRAYVIDLATRDAEPVTEPAVSAFGPIWDAGGALAIGTLNSRGESRFVRVAGGEITQVAGSGSGFDVPLAYLPDGSHLVRAFERPSATAPGRASLTLIDSNGGRHVLSTRDVTLAGWSSQ